MIHFESKKGSLRATSRFYVFGRSMKTIVVDSGSADFKDTYEISPYALAALHEIDYILSITRPNKSTLKQLVMHELDGLDDMALSGVSGEQMKMQLHKLRDQAGSLSLGCGIGMC